MIFSKTPGPGSIRCSSTSSLPISRPNPVRQDLSIQSNAGQEGRFWMPGGQGSLYWPSQSIREHPAPDLKTCYRAVCLITQAEGPSRFRPRRNTNGGFGQGSALRRHFPEYSRFFLGCPDHAAGCRENEMPPSCRSRIPALPRPQNLSTRTNPQSCCSPVPLFPHRRDHP